MQTGRAMLTNVQSEVFLHKNRLTNPKSEAYLLENRSQQVNLIAYNYLPRSCTCHKPENHKLRRSYHEYEGRTSSATL